MLFGTPFAERPLWWVCRGELEAAAMELREERNKAQRLEHQLEVSQEDLDRNRCSAAGFLLQQCVK